MVAEWPRRVSLKGDPLAQCIQNALVSSDCAAFADHIAGRRVRSGGSREAVGWGDLLVLPRWLAARLTAGTNEPL